MGEGTDTPDSTAHLVDLIINQDHLAQGWIKHLISIEAALAVGLGFILKIGGEKPGLLEQRFMPWAIGLIPAFGILAATILCIIIVRERKCQAAYVLKFNALKDDSVKAQGILPSIFPTNAEISALRIGYISRGVIAFTTLLGIFWLVVFIALWVAKSHV